MGADKLGYPHDEDIALSSLTCWPCVFL